MLSMSTSKRTSERLLQGPGDQEGIFQGGDQEGLPSACPQHHPDINPGDKVSGGALQGDPGSLRRVERSRKAQGLRSLRGRGCQRLASRRRCPGLRVPRLRQWQCAFVRQLWEIFSDLFGRRGRPAADSVRKGQDLEYQVKIPFLDAVNGAEKRINFNRQAACETCRGSGSRPGIEDEALSRMSRERAEATTTREHDILGDLLSLRGLRPDPARGLPGLFRSRIPGRFPRRSLCGSLRVSIPASRVRIPNKGNGGLNGGPHGDPTF